jgi:DNA-binding transcriptional regulator LsrR (DeoR family)
MTSLEAFSDDLPGSSEFLRLLTKTAVLYHEEGLTQAQVARRLQLSQTRVSRYLKEAEELGIVRTSVVQPLGIHVGLEKALEDKYGLQEVVVVDHIEGASLLTRLGSSAATYLETTLARDDVVGISSWSSTLLATAEAMRSRPRRVVKAVAQLMGGVGSPQAQVLATRMTSHLAQLLSARPHYLAAPGVCQDSKVTQAFLSDPAVQETVKAWGSVTSLLVGVGTFPASPMIAASGNVLSNEEQTLIAEAGAVGEICLRYFEADGKPMKLSVDERIIAIDSPTLLSIPRRIGVAGGMQKLDAIRGALLGGWLSVLITDSEVAINLLEPPRTRVRRSTKTKELRP